MIKKKNSLRLGGPWEPIGNNFYPAFFDTHFVAYKNACIEISGKVRVQTGCLFRIQANARLILGEDILFNSFDMIYCYDMIKVGNGVVIGPYVKIRDSDSHHFEYPGYDKKTTAPIILEDHVWIGLNVTILKGVTIGEGAVIAAGSVVTKSIPPHCLAGGNPAKVLRENVVWK
ncbi:acyltransferase [uncultured Parabacteroides sp.]|uniref:acyltransferase n=1 Tax=uncultured Parabacteroides sp. TaxID=512312 RepID=UPI00259BBEEB|nr:acyltransferase [uncultured Parabacteroides sp.]